MGEIEEWREIKLKSMAKLILNSFVFLLNASAINATRFPPRWLADCCWRTRWLVLYNFHVILWAAKINFLIGFVMMIMCSNNAWNWDGIFFSALHIHFLSAAALYLSCSAMHTLTGQHKIILKRVSNSVGCTVNYRNSSPGTPLICNDSQLHVIRICKLHRAIIIIKCALEAIRETREWKKYAKLLAFFKNSIGAVDRKKKRDTKKCAQIIKIMWDPWPTWL